MMNQVSAVLRRGEGRFFHWCPACEQTHPLPDNWVLTGDLAKPTFAPSFKQGFVHWTGGVNAQGLGSGTKENRVCHYIITDGKIQFCPDSWHKRSDIVAMPPIPTHLSDVDDGFKPSGTETQD